MMPTSVVADSPAQYLSVPVASLGDALILLVEDEGPLAELLANLLGRIHARVLIANDGVNALARFEEHRGLVSLAFVDCNLPDIAGPELCEKMREMSPGLPLLLTSGRNQDALENRFLAGGPCGFLPKPYLPAEVLRRVTALLGRAA
jgi:two-component system, cell cycle sensor histidine kinase and response regulator CckA